MTTKSQKISNRLTLEKMAVMDAMHADKPNSRSPSFAIQSVIPLLKKAGMIENEYELIWKTIEGIDDVIRDQVTWNEEECHWQTGKGTNVSFNKIKQDVIRWYVHGWDFKRHTRDSEVEYPEDFANFFSKEEIQHLANSLVPDKYELTRRIFTSPNHKTGLYYIEVVPLENGHFSAAFGYFDNPRYHRIIGNSKTLWDLEVNTILPLLRGCTVLRNTIENIAFKMGV